MEESNLEKHSPTWSTFLRPERQSPSDRGAVEATPSPEAELRPPRAEGVEPMRGSSGPSEQPSRGGATPANANLACPDISIVVPAYNEATNLRRLADEVRAALGAVPDAWELIVVDDGSRDETWNTIERLHAEDPRIFGVRLSRNFGHQNALLAGLHHARGSAIITMDADLQHPPRLLPILIAEWRKGSKIVKTLRHDPAAMPLFKRLTSKYYYRLFSYLSGVDLTEGMADFRLLDREVLSQILNFHEEGLFLRGIVEWVGYSSRVIEFESEPRFSGQTKYSLSKMLQLAWHGVSAFSLVPLRIGIALGLSASVISFVGVLYAIIGRMISGGTVAGWSSTVAIMSFLFSVLFIFLAILGEYLGRVLAEVRRRPRYIVSERIDSPYVRRVSE